jgi:hypothetical protein
MENCSHEAQPDSGQSTANEVNSASLLIGSLWRSPERFHQIGMIDRQTRSFRNIPVKSSCEGIERAQSVSIAGNDAYFACAEYENPNSRTASNASGAYAFWMDIDCSEEKANAGKGYATEEDAKEALKQFCQDVGLPEPTFIVSSGSGLHIYWVLDTFIARENWQSYARKLKGLTRICKFLADDTRTADIASVLRVPGTLNYKYDPPRMVTVKRASSDHIEQSAMLAAIDNAHFRLCSVATPKQIEKAALPHPSSQSQSEPIARLEALLKHIDPDCGYEDWLHVLMATYHETDGCEEGFQLADAWSSQGKTYKGSREIRVKWDSFKSYQGKPITIATLVKMAKDNGADLSKVYPGLSEQFDRCDTEVVAAPTLPSLPNPLDRFSLLGKSEELEKHAVEEVFVMGEIVLKGQATAIYAAPNTGKTLLTFSLLAECIRLGRIDPAKLYYLNMDDTGGGLREKVRLAEEYGFHVLAEGHQDFMVNAFIGTISEMLETNQCKDVVIVLDTLKKFTNLMDKAKSSGFAKVIRRFVVKGGTLIALAHTNKNPGQNGKPVYGGTTDIVDDFDCAYTLAMVSTDQVTKVVEFENFKRRGNVAQTAAYSYSVERGISYAEILLSVKPIDPAQLEPIKQAEAMKSDTEIIAAITACIAEGVNTKMKLAEAAAKRAEISKRTALQVIDKYTGTDPAVHRWNFTVIERGAKVYVRLSAQTDSSGSTSG